MAPTALPPHHWWIIGRKLSQRTNVIWGWELSSGEYKAPKETQLRSTSHQRFLQLSYRMPESWSGDLGGAPHHSLGCRRPHSYPRDLLAPLLQVLPSGVTAPNLFFQSIVALPPRLIFHKPIWYVQESRYIYSRVNTAHFAVFTNPFLWVGQKYICVCVCVCVYIYIYVLHVYT